jgi:GMP synthase-like glutamine amidotransferase
VTKKAYVVGGAWAYLRPFRELFERADSIANADVVMFTGGGDVEPAFYGEKNVASAVERGRDKQEMEAFNYAKEQSKGMIGICRGAQFLTVAVGGLLYQDVDNHAIFGEHTLTCADGTQLSITSTHHQMMRPRGKYELIAWCTHRSERYLTDKGEGTPELGVDPEIVFYPETRSLCIQGHPEYMDCDAPVCVYLRDLVKRKLLS